MGLSQNHASRRRVLVIAYYFPPLGLSGVQRVSKFVKYLPEFGWEPTVVTAVPAGYFAFDTSLERELDSQGIHVVRTPSTDPTRLFGARRPVGIPSERLRRATSAISQFLFVPDNKIGWKRSALRAVRQAVAAERVDLILSSAPPYTAHLVGVVAKERHQLPLMLDFRDDWLGNPRHSYPTRLHSGLHRRLERTAIHASDHIICVNEHIRASLLSRHRGVLSPPDVTMLPQGFDPDDFPPRERDRTNHQFVVLYAGVFYDAQKPDTMLHAVAKLVGREPNLRRTLRLEFAGSLPSYAPSLAERLGIGDVVRYLGYLPHSEVVERMQDADVLWMTVGRRPGAAGITTGKLFEYFGARRPILALVPEGEAREVLNQYNAAVIVEPDDVDEVATGLGRLAQQWKEDSLPLGREDFIRQFDRRMLTKRLAGLMNQVVARP